MVLKQTDYMFYYGFQSPGEKTKFINGTLYLSGDGTDLGCGIVINKDISQYNKVELKIRGHYEKKVDWTRLRFEIYGTDDEEKPAVIYEEKESNEWNEFTAINIPLEDKVHGLFKIQIMMVGPAIVDLEFKDIDFKK